MAVIAMGTWSCSGDDEETQSVSEAGYDVNPIIVEDLAIGATQQITVANAGGETLVYSSGDTKIATVSASGLITGIAQGSAGITVRNESGTTRQAVNVTVYKALETITPEVTDIDMFVYGIEDVKFALEPEDATYRTVEYTSSNPAVATVVDGEIKAVGVGEAVIAITSVQPHNVVISTEIRVRVTDVMTTVVGRWQFEDAANLGKASVGQDLVAYKVSENNTSGNPSDEGFSQVAGPVSGSHAVRISRYSYYRCYHQIAANGGGSNVNEYTFMVDFKVPSAGQYYCFLQTVHTNDNDGDIFLRPSRDWGFRSEYTTNVLFEAGKWHRMVFTVKLGETVKYYLDGVLVDTRMSGNFGIDSERASLPLEYVMLFADNDGDDNEFDLAETAIWDRALTEDEAKSLGIRN